MSYSYDPARLNEYGKDRMRFELGDVMTEGGADTCALTDEEYNAVITEYGQAKWKRATYKLLESVVHRFSYEVDTKVGHLDLALSDRYKRWKALLDELKKEIENTAVPVGSPRTTKKPPYFSTGMHDNRPGGPRHVP